jgi:hypothetical protein
MAAECGSDGSARKTDAAAVVQPFLGTWTPTSGAIALNCGGTITSDRATDTTKWVAGTTSDLVQPADSSGCSLRANVSGNTATLLPGQMCTQQTNGSSLTIALSTYTFTVASDGKTASEQASGTAVLTGATTADCTYNATVSYTKVSP